MFLETCSQGGRAPIDKSKSDDKVKWLGGRFLAIRTVKLGKGRRGGGMARVPTIMDTNQSIHVMM